jgi:hypothetical protein
MVASTAEEVADAADIFENDDVPLLPESACWYSGGNDAKISSSKARACMKWA